MNSTKKLLVQEDRSPGYRLKLAHANQTNGYLSKKTVRDVVELLESSDRTQKMVSNNYQIAARHYSYSVLRSQLTPTIRMFFGDSVEPLTANAPENKSDDYLYIDPQLVMYKRYDSRSCRVGS